jgi:putative ABC transport system substrate-binding protein
MIARRALPLLLATPALAQTRMRRLGLLSPGTVPYERFRAVAMPELAREGFVEGRNLALLARVAESFGPPLRAAAAELLALRPEVISAASVPAVEALYALDTSTPIAMFGSSPLVGSPMAQSFARPSRSVTGVVLLAEELNIKRVDLAVEAFPGTRQLGFLAGSLFDENEAEGLRATAARHGIRLAVVRLPRPGAEAEAVRLLAEAGVTAVVVGASPILASRVAAIVAATRALGLPTLCEMRPMAMAGCTLSYGPDVDALRRRHAHQIARILRGEHPSTIPIELADRFETVVNQGAANALNLRFDHIFLARADVVIE